jgi:hypothetical protein
MLKGVTQQQEKLRIIYYRTDEANNPEGLRQIYRKEVRTVIPVDSWTCPPEDEYFKQIKGALWLPVAEYYGVEDDDQFNCFILTTKRCYNNDDMRDHLCKYLNYFEKFYDPEHELLAVFYQIKYLIDYEDSYTKEALMYDLKRYILQGRIGHRVSMMNEDNYNLDLSYYRNSKNPGLQYTNKHGLILMEISLFQNIFIPILTHFIAVRKIKEIKFFLLEFFQMIIDKYDSVDIINKLYETALSTVEKNADAHPILWNMQNIRAKNVTTHSIQTVMNIILQIVPKYTYDKNIINFNYKSVLKSTSYQVIDIGYEFNLKSLSSSKRDDDNNSEFDKFDAHIRKADESLYVQNKVNCEDTIMNICRQYPVSEEEIDFYERELTKDGKKLIIDFQKTLIFNLFYNDFGDIRSINAINARDYVRLVIAAKKKLLAQNMKLLPYVVSGKIVRLVNRVAINKKELTKIEASQYYPLIERKYRNPKMSKLIYAIIATMLSSKFQFIDYQSQMEYEHTMRSLIDQYGSRENIPPTILEEVENYNINGKPINVIPEFICEEVLMYIQLI